MKVEWLQDSQRRIFTLCPFSLVSGHVDKSDIRAIGARKSGGMVLVAGFGGEATVMRFAGTVDALEKAALSLSRETGNPVIIGKTIALDKDLKPVFKSVGRVLTAKANPLSTEAFDSWVAKLTNSLSRIFGEETDRLIVESLNALDIDYLTATEEQLDGILRRFETIISNPRTGPIRAQTLEIERQTAPVIRSTSSEMARQEALRTTLATGFALPDRQAAELIAQHHSFWVRNRYGQISDTLSAQSRAIISDGVSEGLGREEIARQLESRIEGGLQQRGYWKTVASNHMARARSYSLGATMRAAGIQYYRIEAVLDDRTTHQCIFLHGKVLPVGAAANRIDRVIADPNPEGVYWNNPFITDNGETLDIEYPDGTSRRVADITQRSTGISPTGPTATFARGISAADLVDSAIGFPPYHHSCRTTVVPA